MKVTTFRAPDMREALRLVKEELGPDAVILSTKRVRERSKSGLPIGKPLIELTACPASAAAEAERLPAPVEGGGRLPRERGEERPVERGAERAPASRFTAVVDDPIQFFGGRPAGEPPRADPRAALRNRSEEIPARDDPRSLARGRSEEPPPRDEPRPMLRGRSEEPPIREEPRPMLRGRSEEPPIREEPRSVARGWSEEPPGREEFSGMPRGWDEEPLGREGFHSPARVRGEEYPRVAGSTARGGGENPELTTLRSSLATLEERVSSLTAELGGELLRTPEVPGLDAEGKRRYGYLLMHGVEEPIARQLALVERSSKERGLEMALRRFVSFHDPLQGEGGKVIALVGPTGVGKTTTLAKIAADLILNRKRTVGFITLDTFRVGAVAQLETYARLLQTKLVVARNPSEVKAGLYSLKRNDFILIDTVGSSPYNRRQVQSTAELLPSMGDDREVLLCMAGNVRETEQRAIFRRFAPLGLTGLIFTKLDETVTYGGILNVALRARLPLTVYTDGQRVPENLGWLSPEVIADWFEQKKGNINPL